MLKALNKILVVIPARAGSKGISRKNIKCLNGKPLISHSIEVAREIFPDSQICVTTDDTEIIELCNKQGLKVHFKRPAELASDTATSQDVLIHAYEYYLDILNKKYDAILLLQPTSPFRKPKHILEAIGLYKGKVDMVASVKATKANPYFTLFEKNERNHLRPIKQSTFTRRQDCPEVYELNGAVYVINTDSLKTKGMANFDFIIPYEMDRLASTDLDEELDWKWAEFLIQEKLMDL